MTLFHLGITVLFALQLADVWTTNRVIAGGGKESNKALAWIMSWSGKRWAAIKLGLMVVACYILWRVGPQPLSWLVLLGAIAAYLFVVHHNWRVSIGQRRR